MTTKTLLIPIRISGKTFMAVVDSAAQVSVINNTLLKQLGPSVKLKEYVMLTGAGKESQIEARITDEIPVEIGKSKLKWKFVTAEINDDIILGIDFLEYNKAVIDLSNFSVSINRENIPAVCMSNETGHMIHVYRVQIKKKTVVPPHTMKITEMDIDKLPDDDIIVQP